MKLVSSISGPVWIRRSWRFIAGGCLLTVVAVWCLCSDWASFPLPSFGEVKENYRSSDVRFLDRQGNLIQRVRIDPLRRNLDWISLDQISPSLAAAVLEAEDRNFYVHSGVEWSALWKGMTGWILGWGERGASTISMQLSSLLAPSLQPGKNQRRTVWQKWRQIQTARRLERIWSKPQILEAYFNLVSFRGELQGVAVASAAFYRKNPHGLNLEESSLLAVLLREPGATTDRAARRATHLLQTMNQPASLSHLEELVQTALHHYQPVNLEPGFAPLAVRRILQDYPGLGKQGQDVQTTLDGPLQRYALEVLQRQLLSLSSQNVRDGAALVIENRSGNVLAYAGNIGSQSSAPQVDGIQARRQAGSTLKPFLYGLALEKRLITAASLLEDTPLEISVATGLYRPENYNRRFLGLVTARTALASSLNIPAVRLLLLAGIEPFTAVLKDLGFRDVEEPAFYGPSLALGSADVTLWDLTNAFRSLANGGVWRNCSLAPIFSSKPTSRRIFTAPVAFLVSDILSDRESRATTFTLENPLATRFWTAVKTGTSKDMRDNWCVGFSRLYTVGVWVGNFSGESMWNVSGITGAAPVWIEIMSYLHRNESSLPPPPPAGLTQLRLKTEISELPQTEWFLTGTEPLKIKKSDPALQPKITSPVQGSVIAWDPDIPPGQQRVLFEAEPATGSYTWILNNQEMMETQGRFLWAPEKGRYRLELRDQQKRIRDSVEFEVRGSIGRVNDAPSLSGESESQPLSSGAPR